MSRGPIAQRDPLPDACDKKLKLWQNVNTTRATSGKPKEHSYRVAGDPGLGDGHAVRRRDERPTRDRKRACADGSEVRLGIGTGAKPGLSGITFDPHVMGGRACVRGMRVTVSLMVKPVANGMSASDIVDAYP